MKLPFTIYDLRFTIWKKSANSAIPNRQSSIANRKSQSGVALILTLILLSVALVMALAFLAISGRVRNSVGTQTDEATTRLAAEAALNAAEGQIAANILASANPYSFGLLVSTNYINPYGFQPGIANPTNVNFDYLSGGGALSQNDMLQCLANLSILPRAPVWLTNYVTRTMENRFYLDLNRNGVDDPNGWVADVDATGKTNGTTSFQVGDPEWIGVLEHPDQPYGPNNPFVARYAYIAVPVGNALDLNAIYNQTLNRFLIPSQDGYFRNQGVGSWELNLAAFLADLNTNQWGYQYLVNLQRPNRGTAFNDALSLLAYRYADNYATLRPVAGLLPLGLFTSANYFPPFQNNIDAYSDGPLQTTTAGISENQQTVTLPWAGSDNTNHFFDLPADLFDPSKTATNVPPAQISAGDYFSGRLANAGRGLSTYDRYTFYRLLSQLGTDSDPVSGKMNLNYDNLDQYVHVDQSGIVVTNPPSATNFMAWTPLGFFTNAADRLLKAYTAQWATSYVLANTAPGVTNLVSALNTNFVATFNVTAPFGVTDIPVWVSNRFVYTPAVQRLLQLAANIYDATTTNYYPSVFRPLFTTNITGGYVNLFITGYTTEVASSLNPTNDPQFSSPVDASTVYGANVVTNVYGVPWIIGAKKGFPNFNAFTMENVFKLTRKLTLTRPNTSVNYVSSPSSYTISQQLTLGLANSLDVECWNSYRADYTNAQPMEIFATVRSTAALTNDEGMNYVLGSYYANAITTSDWKGYGNYIIPQQASFLYPLYLTNAVVLPDSIYTFNPNNPLVPYNPAYFVANTLMPHWTLLLTNRVRVAMVEHNPVDNLWHVIDYVQLAGPDSSRDLSADIQSLYDTKVNSGYDDMWDTNRDVQGQPMGIANQLGVSMGVVAPILSPYWENQDSSWVTNQIALFSAFLGFSPIFPIPPSAQPYVQLGESTLTHQAPYGPTATVVYETQWEANDPLVHYLASDLTDLNRSTAATEQVSPLITWQLNDRYMPWGGNPQFSGKDLNPYNLALKDPLVRSSDDWNFPDNKFPTVGWLGRVHRGTPWQTVFLKSTNLLAEAGNAGFQTWVNWTGDANGYDAVNSAPVTDRLLFDLFTTTPNDNASRGTLSVNAGAGNADPAADLAAWSAVFSGVVVPTNSAGSFTFINPAGPDAAALNPPLWQIVTNINTTRADFQNPDGLTGAFEHKGDILAAPALTDQSPFLAGLDPDTQISDAMYEWLPQQVMSLLRDSDSPSYVIYSYAQALKPAQGGIYLGAGPFFGMVTNYQVVSETATRAVVQFDTARRSVANGTNNVIGVTPPQAVIKRFNILPPD